jgi:hypothetical protein
MARKVLECRSLLPDTSCQLLLIGEVDEVVGAFRLHVASAHPDVQPVDLRREATASRMQSLIVDGGDRAYIGDQFDEVDSGGIRVSGPGFVLRRMASGGGAGIDMKCQCMSGPGSCSTTIAGPIATCSGSCNDCTFVVTLPPGSLENDWLLIE